MPILQSYMLGFLAGLCVASAAAMLTSIKTNLAASMQDMEDS